MAFMLIETPDACLNCLLNAGSYCKVTGTNFYANTSQLFDPGTNVLSNCPLIKGDDKIEYLTCLVKMLDEGLLTKEEFNVLQDKVIAASDLIKKE